MSNDELMSLLRSVIKEELDPIKEEMQTTRAQMNLRFDTIETKLSRVEDNLAAVKASVARLEANEPQDIVGLLKQINTKLDAQRDLTERVSDLETDVKVIKKAITNQ